MGNDNLYHKIALILAFILIIAIFTPFATPIDQGVDSKEALSYVWIWGLCYGQGELFYLLNPLSIINFYLSFFLVGFALMTLISSFALNNNKMSYSKFGEHVFIYNLLIILISFILMEIIEYSFLFFPDVPYIFDTIRADFWEYHNPGFGFLGLLIFSFLLLFGGLIAMHHDKSNFFPYATFLSIILIFIMVFFGIFWVFPF